MKIIKRNLKFLLKVFLRMRLLSAFIAVILIFISFTFLTYLYINGNIKDKRLSKVVTNSRSETYDVFEASNRLPRIQSYCNPFTTIALNEEIQNQMDSDSELMLFKAFIVIRHGDRGPLRSVRNQSSISCDPFLTSGANNLQTFIKRFFIEINDRLKHSLRDKSLNLMANSNSLESGLLSRFGFVQHLTLGSLLAQFYRNKLNISSDQMKVYSTPYSRTYQSAVAFVYGFLKPKSFEDFKNFPKISTTFGTFFCFNREFCPKICPKYDELHKILNENKKQILSSHPAVLQLVNNLKAIIANHNESLLFSSPMALFDGLMAYMCHNHRLPCDQKCVSLEDIKQLVSFIEYHGKQLSVSHEFKHSEWLKIYGFLNHLSERMNETKISPKLTLYSGHDITIVGIISALNLFDGILPPYASRLIFETYIHKNQIKDIYIRIIYNGKDMTRFTEICKSFKCFTFDSKHEFYLISIKDFKEYVFEKFQYFTKTNESQTACNS